MPDEDALDIERLTYAWEAGEDYDANWLSQPWDDREIPVAFNDVGNGWACRIDRVILVEESSGRHVAHVYETVAEAEAAWPEYERDYGGGMAVDMLNPPMRDVDGEL